MRAIRTQIRSSAARWLLDNCDEEPEKGPDIAGNGQPTGFGYVGHALLPAEATIFLQYIRWRVHAWGSHPCELSRQRRKTPAFAPRTS
jgi:hypothetical protein